MRRSTLAALSGFLAGVVATLWFSGKLSIILACGFDWTVVWTAVQAIAISIAALIALGQLGSYLDTERDKNTVALFQELDAGEIDETIGELTRNNDTQKDIEAARNELTNPISARALDFSRRLQTLLNLFNRVASQYGSGTINRAMYLERMDELTLRVYAVCKAVQSDSHHRWDLEELAAELIGDCKRNYVKCVKPGNADYDNYLATMNI